MSREYNRSDYTELIQENPDDFNYSEYAGQERDLRRLLTTIAPEYSIEELISLTYEDIKQIMISKGYIPVTIVGLNRDNFYLIPIEELAKYYKLSR